MKIKAQQKCSLLTELLGQVNYPDKYIKINRCIFVGILGIAECYIKTLNIKTYELLLLPVHGKGVDRWERHDSYSNGGFQLNRYSRFGVIE